MISEDLAVYMQAIRADHREFAGYLRPLRRIAEDKESSAEADSITQVCKSIDDLRSFMRRHFEREEAGGYLDEAAARDSQLSDDVVKLVKQHRALLERVDEAAVIASECRHAPARWSALKATIRTMLEMLTEHETAEQRVLGQGFESDPDLR